MSDVRTAPAARRRTTRRLLRAALPAIAAIVAGACGDDAVVAAPPDLGPAPAVVLQPLTAGGTAVALGDLAGHVVYVEFWTTTCPPCRDALLAADAVAAERAADGLRVLAVNVGEQPEVARAALVSRPTPALRHFADPRQQVAASFGVDGVPTSVLIDRRGRLRAVERGYAPARWPLVRGRIAAVLAEADPGAASPQP
jgi:thiol-disulfide isomerase/thioredoxin